MQQQMVAEIQKAKNCEEWQDVSGESEDLDLQKVDASRKSLPSLLSSYDDKL